MKSRFCKLLSVTYSSDGRLFPISCRRMSHICTKEDDRLLEDQRPGARTQSLDNIKCIFSKYYECHDLKIYTLIISVFNH